MPPFRKRTESDLWSGSFFRVARLEVEGPGGDVLEREVVRHRGAVVVVPVTADGEVVLVRQYRAAVGSELLEVPAGKRDVDGEAPDVTAQRELAEEVGLRAGRLDLLCRFYNSPGFSDEETWLYLARDLTEVAHDRQGAEEQAMSVERLPFVQVDEEVTSGRITDAKTIIGLCLARDVVSATSDACIPDE